MQLHSTEKVPNQHLNKNQGNLLLKLPNEILFVILSYLTVHDIIKLNVLCVLSHKTFQDSKRERLFKQILTRDFPDEKLPKKIESYFNFYKALFLKDSYLCIAFSKNLIPHPSPNHTKVFEDDFLEIFSTTLSQHLYLLPTFEQLQVYFHFRSVNRSQYFGYFKIKLPIETAQKYLNEKKYEQLLSKATFFANHNSNVCDSVPPNISCKVIYDSNAKKFKPSEVLLTQSQNESSIHQDLTL